MNDFYVKKINDILTNCMKYLDVINRRQEQQTEIQYRILQELKLINDKGIEEDD